MLYNIILSLQCNAMPLAMISVSLSRPQYCVPCPIECTIVHKGAVSFDIKLVPYSRFGLHGRLPRVLLQCVCIEAATLTRGTWALTWEWALAWDTIYRMAGNFRGV